MSPLKRGLLCERATHSLWEYNSNDVISLDVISLVHCSYAPYNSNDVISLDVISLVHCSYAPYNSNYVISLDIISLVHCSYAHTIVIM